MALATVVVEANLTSGALITANFATTKKRPPEFRRALASRMGDGYLFVAGAGVGVIVSGRFVSSTAGWATVGVFVPGTTAGLVADDCGVAGVVIPADGLACIIPAWNALMFRVW